MLVKNEPCYLFLKTFGLVAYQLLRALTSKNSTSEPLKMCVDDDFSLVILELVQ